jgi:hypothetical protein
LIRVFDTERYTRSLERAFDAMWEAYARGQKLRAIRIEPYGDREFTRGLDH